MSRVRVLFLISEITTLTGSNDTPNAIVFAVFDHITVLSFDFTRFRSPRR